MKEKDAVDPELLAVADHDEELVLDHEPKLAKSFNLISACATGITIGNTWASLGGGINASLYNGGPAGAIFEFIVVTFFYMFITLSLAELAAALPSSGGVYHWTSVIAGPKFGRALSAFSGWLNGLAYAFAAASNCAITGNILVYAYSLYHDDFKAERWHVFICFVVMSWLCCCVVMFGSSLLPLINRAGTVIIIVGFFISIFTCAVMPKYNGRGVYASSQKVWQQWDNRTGYSNNGLVFLMGMLNGAYAVGAVDSITHIAEEVPNPRKDIPTAMFIQLALSFGTGLCYLIAIFYAAHDLDSIIQTAPIAPIGAIYLQATASKAITVFLLIIIVLTLLCATIGGYITVGRTFYVLGRDGITPLAVYFGSISVRWQSPLRSTFASGVFMTCIGLIYLGSLTAFNAFIGSFIVLSTSSYLLAILPHLLTGRKHRLPSVFWLGKSGYWINAIACAYIIVSIVLFCFPYSLPTSASTMNYTAVITSGLTVLVALWWSCFGRKQTVHELRT